MAQPWKVSLHGGHSRAYCDHAHDPLRAMLDAAAAAGYHTFGVTEHAPRLGGHYLYDQEIAMGWTVEKLERDFAAYCRDVAILAEEYDGRLCVLRGFEIETIPEDRYIDLMLAYRAQGAFEYMVGSVHFLHEISIDGPPEGFEKAMDAAGGYEALCVAYYDRVAEMVDALRPEVVGHLDVIHKNGHRYGAGDDPAIREAAARAVDAVVRTGGILDLNTAGYRKGLPTPYPAPWLLELARDRGAAFCFGDDSHCVADVGAGLDEARRYLLDHGIASVTVLTREDGRIVKRAVPL